MPFYMAYSMSVDYNSSRRDSRDFEYLKSLYPDHAKRILPYLEEEFDRMDHRFSMMYDEYPDKFQLRLMCQRVQEKINALYQPHTDGLADLVEVMMFHELYRRRSDQRRAQFSRIPYTF